MALPANRIKQISISQMVENEATNVTYDIVPSMLNKNGYSAELPNITKDSIIATTDLIKEIYSHYITIKANNDTTVISCRVLTQSNTPMIAAEFAQFVYDEMPDSTGTIVATGTIQVSSLDHRYVGAIGKGSSNANITVYPLVSTGGYGTLITLAASSITSFVDVVDRIGAHGAGSSGSIITSQDVINALGYVPSHVVANPSTTTGDLTGLGIDGVNYAIQGGSGTSKTPLVPATPAATFALDGYKMYNFGTLSTSMILSFNAVESGYCAEYSFRFTAGVNCAITLPNTVKYSGGVAPTFVTGRVYEYNIVDNLVVVGEFY